MGIGVTYIGALVGPAGGGKSLTLAALCVWQMLAGRKVWSNMRVKTSPAIVNRKQFFGKSISPCETEELDLNLVYMLDESLVDGTVAIDEMGYFADSRQSGSVRNRLVNGCIRQVRHRNLNFFYTALDFDMVDYRLRKETDFIVTCEDLSFKPWGKDNHVEGGIAILQRYYDLTGKMTGKRTDFFSPDRRPYKVRRFLARPYWECYDTREVISLEEAFSGVELDLQKSKISNRDSYSEATGAAIVGALVELKQAGHDRVPNDMLWAYLEQKGIEGAPSKLGQYIPRSVKRGQGRDGSFYDLSNWEVG